MPIDKLELSEAVPVVTFLSKTIATLYKKLYNKYVEKGENKMKHFYKIQIFTTGETTPTELDYGKDKGLAIHDYAFYKKHMKDIDKLVLLKDGKQKTAIITIKEAPRYKARKEI